MDKFGSAVAAAGRREAVDELEQSPSTLRYAMRSPATGMSGRLRTHAAPFRSFPLSSILSTWPAIHDVSLHAMAVSGPAAPGAAD